MSMTWYEGDGKVNPSAFKEYAIAYTPFEPEAANRARRHEERAEYWLSMGKPDYASGSMRKAAKARQELREYDMWWNGPLPAHRDESLMCRHIRMAQESLLRAVEESILEGDK